MHQQIGIGLRGSTEVPAASTGRQTGEGVWTELSGDVRQAAMPREYRSFSEFWPFYLREHSKSRTRTLHYVGTSLVIAIAILAVLTGRWLLLLAIPLAGYGFAWVAHFRIEKNRPATFTYPLWSLAADFRMWWFWLTGRLAGELARAGVEE